MKATAARTADADSGAALYQFAERLYPICRSITGQGVRQTLALIAQRLPLAIHEVRSGTKVFDWQIPAEWNIEDAAVTDPDGRRVVDFQAHNLHLVGYSEPVKATVSLDELATRLHVLPAHPEWIPYRTSYYTRSWGFCMAASRTRAPAAGSLRRRDQVLAGSPVRSPTASWQSAAARARRCCSSRTPATHRLPMTMSAACRSPRHSRNGSRARRDTSPTGSCSRPGRSDR